MSRPHLLPASVWVIPHNQDWSIYWCLLGQKLVWFHIYNGYKIDGVSPPPPPLPQKQKLKSAVNQN